MSVNSFGAKATLQVGDASYEIFRLDAVEGQESLPYSLKILLENLLRTEDGANITADDIRALAGWDPSSEPSKEIQFTPARVIMQDFTGVPCVVDLATMREAMADMGGDANKINPLAPGRDGDRPLGDRGRVRHRRRVRPQRRDRVRPQPRALPVPALGPDGLRRLQGRPARHRHRPPGQHRAPRPGDLLARRRQADGTGETLAYPDTCVGTDSHTTMVNGLGVVGWGVGGIEAEAAMLGQPVSMLIPRVVGFKLSGSMPEGATATDLVLTITEMLRQHKVVGKFVEFYGPGVSEVPLANRATIGNMSPEYGSTIAVFPIDSKTTDYLRLTGRSEEQIALVETYAQVSRGCGTTTIVSRASPSTSSSISPPSCRASPARSVRRTGSSWPTPSRVSARRCGTTSATRSWTATTSPWTSRSLPRTRRAMPLENGSSAPHEYGEDVPANIGRPSKKVPVTLSDGSSFEIDHGAVTIAAITSCTNTSNPSVMIGAALVAKKAVEKGLTRKPWVKTTLAPGSKVVSDYYDRSGLTPYLDKLGFNLVGYGCTTCIGNSGPLIPEVSQAIQDNDLAAVSVLSGNRNFEGRINPDVKMNYLASPPLVVAYALAGSMDIDITTESLGDDESGNPVYLKDIWPTQSEIDEIVASAIGAEMFTDSYADVFAGDQQWQSLPTPEGETFEWDPDSTYVRKPPYFDGMPADPVPVTDISGARVLLKLGDSITTDHISPAGSIKADAPAGKYLSEHGVDRKDFNSYGSRRGNHEVMIRGTFANIRLRNQLAPGTEGGFTRDFTRRQTIPTRR